MRDDERTNEQLKIEILSQWKLEAESRKKYNYKYNYETKSSSNSCFQM